MSVVSKGYLRAKNKSEVKSAIFYIVEQPLICHFNFLSSVKHPHGSPKHLQEPFMENLQRPSETSKKDRGHRKTDPSQHKGRACIKAISKTMIVKRQKRHTWASQCNYCMKWYTNCSVNDLCPISRDGPYKIFISS